MAEDARRIEAVVATGAPRAAKATEKEGAIF